VLVEPLATLLGWQVGETETVETLLGDEEGSQPLLIPDSTRPIGRLLAVPGEASLDHAPEGSGANLDVSQIRGVLLCGLESSSD
jgi:hypothetical protein